MDETATRSRRTSIGGGVLAHVRPGSSFRAEMALVLVLVMAMFLLPRGLPGGVVGLGLVSGALLSLQAMGVVLLYSRTKILSFAQFGLGAAAAILFYVWVVYNQWAVLANGVCGCLGPQHVSMSEMQHHPDAFRHYLAHHHPWALVVNAIISAALGVLLAADTGRRVYVWLSVKFGRAPRIVPTIVTLALAITLGSAGGMLQLRTTTVFGWHAFSWFPYGPQPGTGIDGRTALPEGTFVSPALHAVNFALGGGPRFHLYEVLTFASALGMLIAIWLRFERGHRGLLSRATAADIERAATLGVDVVRESKAPWMMAGALSGLAGVLSVTLAQSAPSVGLDMTSLTLVLAAVVLARMTSVAWAAWASLALGVLQQGMFWNFHSQTQFEGSLAIIIGAALLLQRRRATRADAASEAVFVSVPEPRPVSAELQNVPGVQGTLRFSAILVLLAVVVYPLATTPSQLSLGITVVALAIVGLSLLVLSGWGGQVSLAQMSLGAVGGWAVAITGVSWHLPLPLALLVGAAAGGAIAPIVGLPALRLPGPFVVIMTLVFALAVPAVFLDSHQLLGRFLPANLPRPVLLGVDFSSDRYYYWLSLTVLLAALAVVVGLRRSRLRRALIAARDNANASAALGLDIQRLRIEAFVVSGALAGLGGGVLSYANGSVTPDAFSPLNSVNLFLIVVVGGLSAVSGPMLGAGAFGLLQLAGATYANLLSGFGTMVVLAVRPGGLASIVFALRDAVVRTLAHVQGADLALWRGADGRGRIPITARGSDTSLVPVRYRLVGEGYGPVEGTRLRNVAGVAASTSTPRAPSSGSGAEEDLTSSFGLAAEVEQTLAAISCSRLGVAYGGVTAVESVSLSVGPGEILAVVGLNGAGKSSLLRALAGLEPVAQGTISMRGEDMTAVLPNRRAERGLSFVPGGSGVLPSLTVRENLAVADGSGEGVPDVLARFPQLEPRLDALAGNLSGGEQQMLAVAQALLRRPEVLLVDELSLGLSPEALQAVLDIVRQLAHDGTAVILVEQSISAAMGIADTALFLESGRARYQGPAQALRDHPELFASIAFGSGGAVAVSSASEVARARQHIDDREVVLHVDHVSAAYGEIRVVEDVSFEVTAGDVIGVIGPNGAGKTSLFDCLSGLLPVTSGTVTLQGQDVTRLPPHRRAALGLMRSFQSVRLFPSLTVRDCIAVALETRLSVKSPVLAGLWLPPARAEERRTEERVDALLELLGLERLAELPLGSLSLGSRRLVDLACQLAARPKVLLLDEPAAGLAQAETELLGPLVTRISSDLDCAVLIVEHNISVLASVAHRLIAMKDGAVIATGPPSAVLADAAVEAAYFGAVATAQLEPSA